MGQFSHIQLVLHSIYTIIQGTSEKPDLRVPSAGNVESLQQILSTAASFNQRIAILQATGTAVPELYPFLFPSNGRNQAPVLKEIGVVGKAAYKLLKKAAEGGVVRLPKHLVEKGEHRL